MKYLRIKYKQQPKALVVKYKRTVVPEWNSDDLPPDAVKVG